MLEKVTVDPSFWELFPDAQVNIMLISGIDNHDTDDNLSAGASCSEKAATRQKTSWVLQLLPRTRLSLNGGKPTSNSKKRKASGLPSKRS